MDTPAADNDDHQGYHPYRSVVERSAACGVVRLEVGGRIKHRQHQQDQRQREPRAQRRGGEDEALFGLTVDIDPVLTAQIGEALALNQLHGEEVDTFRLLDRLQRNDVLDPLRRRARGGMPYMGASAGTNMACPTIRTTNDMPIGICRVQGRATVRPA